MAFVGNYFWTHYFYVVLGARYSFPVTLELNKVPVMLYFITHAYFMSYHAVSNVLLRRLWTSTFYEKLSTVQRKILSCFAIFLLAYITALMEAITIASVPYYSVIGDRFSFYFLGSAFYGIYFYVSFPMFFM